MSDQKVVYLENWGVTRHPHYPSTKPALCGLAYGHPRFSSGESVTTSPIAELRDGHVVTESGTVYQLGRANPNALGASFAVNREFSYLVLVLCCFSRDDAGLPPANILAPFQPSPVPAEMSLAASFPDSAETTVN